MEQREKKEKIYLCCFANKEGMDHEKSIQKDDDGFKVVAIQWPTKGHQNLGTVVNQFIHCHADHFLGDLLGQKLILRLRQNFVIEFEFVVLVYATFLDAILAK